MGFNSVYQFLTELFPQIDARILKAVAIEHSKDPNGAVESIFTEVLPFICKQSNIPSSSVENNGRTVASTIPSSSLPVLIEGEDANAFDKLNNEVNITSMCGSDTFDDSLTSSFYDAKDTDDHLSTNTKNETNISFGQYQEVGAVEDEDKKSEVPSVKLTGECAEENINQPFGNHVGETLGPSHEFQDIQVNKIGNASSFSNNVDDPESDASLSSDQSGHLNHFNGHTSYDCNFNECRNFTEQASDSLKDDILDALFDDMPLVDGVNQELSCYIDADFIQKSPMLDEVGKDNAELSTIVTRSCQICEIGLLQDIVENAKNYKLHDFLMDKGRLLDVLQGEISVICQGVKSLKENFDDRVSLSNSLSFWQTNCHRAPSNSSVKSMASDVAPGLREVPESPSRISRETSVECQTPRSFVDELGVKAALRKELLDDWELFDFREMTC